jgi:TP901 family phage tail tape measure protein
MSGSLGVGFVIGATLSASVGNAFSTVDQKIQATRAAMGKAAKESKVMSQALSLRSRRDDLSAKLRASGGKDAALRKELTKVSEQYRKAKTAALGYGAGVSEWGRRQDEARSRLAKANDSLRLNHALKQNADKRRELRGRLMETVAPVLAVAATVKLAIDYEEAMADVKKVTSFSDEEFKKFGDDLLRMTTRIAISARGAAEIAAAAGPSVAKEELAGFVESAGKMAVAFDMSAKDAGAAMASLRSNYHLTQKQVIALGDAVNHVSNNMKAKAGAGDIVKFTESVSGIASIYGITAEQMVAFGATMISAGKAPEVASRAANTLMTSLGNAGEASKDAQAAFKRLGFQHKVLGADFKKDGQGVLHSFLTAVKRSKDPMRELTAILGSGFSDDIALVVNNLGEYENALKNATDRAANLGSMEKEYAARAETTANNLLILKNNLVRLAINVTSVLLPPLNSLLNLISPLISGIASFAQRNQTLTQLLVGVAVGLVAVKAAAIGGAYAATFMGGGLLHITKFLGFFIPSLASATTVGKVFSVTMRGIGKAMRFAFGPWGLLISAVTLGFGYLWETSETFREVFTGLWESLASVPAMLGEAFSLFFEETGEKIKEFFSSIPFLSEAVSGLKKFFGGKKEDIEVKPAGAAPTSAGAAAGVEARAGKEAAASGGAGSGKDKSAAPAAATSGSSPSRASAPAGTPEAAKASTPGASAPFTFQFIMNGVPDRPFADGVINALERRKSELERIVSSVVHDQMRVAYGS